MIMHAAVTWQLQYYPSLKLCSIEVLFDYHLFLYTVVAKNEDIMQPTIPLRCCGRAAIEMGFHHRARMNGQDVTNIHDAACIPCECTPMYCSVMLLGHMSVWRHFSLLQFEHTYTCIHNHISVHLYIYIYIYIYSHMYIHINMSLDVYDHLHVFVYTYV